MAGPLRSGSSETGSCLYSTIHVFVRTVSILFLCTFASVCVCDGGGAPGLPLKAFDFHPVL